MEILLRYLKHLITLVNVFGYATSNWGRRIVSLVNYRSSIDNDCFNL